MKTNNVSPADGVKSTEMITVGGSKGTTQDLCDLVAKKTKTYDANAGQDGEAEFDTTEKIGWWGMCKRERSTSDAIKFYIGNSAAILVGSALPGFCLVFGNMIDGVAGTGTSDGDADEFNALQKQALYMVYIGAALFMIGLCQVTMLT